ncbi:MAG: hypothetical protein DRP10_02575 [Candidatus Aenigmatarchaeota archaeon]|nr:MAG: hypothetical protein DRP10_02575 [Candidatus Aenigmarchaeota archaeon]
MAEFIDDLEKYGSKGGKYLGRFVCAAPFETRTEFNFTLPKGKGTDLWVGFLINLEKKGYTVQKVSESLEISPVDVGYYNLTQKQKEEMEARIKQGLASVANAVSDYELLAHDRRKYEELLKMLETGDEHSLRATFIDEVDINTGPNSIKGMVVRWPTIIADFMTLGEKMPEETDVNKIKDELKISKAEAVILSTKQRLYNNWKQIFGPEVRGRLERIIAQQNSRKKTIEEYKNWLKPLIARYKLYKEGLSETAKETLISPYHSPAQAVSTNIISICAWQPVVEIELRGGTFEMKEDTKFGIEPYDRFTKEKLILDKKIGLKSRYPWINEEWVDKSVAEIKKEWLKENRLYYVFLQVKNTRVVLKSATGSEIEDITLNTKNWFVSQNALLALLLELKAKQEEFDREINQLLGITGEEGLKLEEEVDKIIEKWKKEGKEKKKENLIKKKISKFKEVFSKISESLGLESAFSRLGPYEHDFDDRITSIYLPTLAIDFYRPHVVGYLLEAAGVGK